MKIVSAREANASSSFRQARYVRYNRAAQLTAQVNGVRRLVSVKEAVYHGTAKNGDKTLHIPSDRSAGGKVSVVFGKPAKTIVKDGAENGTVLREGSSVIIKADDLYDGKVVGR